MPRGPCGRARGAGAGALAHRRVAGPASGGPLAPELRPVHQKDLARAPGCRQARGGHDPSVLSKDFWNPQLQTC